MSTVIVLFNLKPGTDVAAYEAWARETDLATVRTLPSIGAFDVYKTSGLMGSDDPSPYAYVEVIDVKDMDQFGKDVATEVMQKVAAEFQGFADNPMFIMASSLDGAA